MILDPNGGMKVLAVLDWELSTLGHPIADLAYSTMMYHLPKGDTVSAVPPLPDDLPEGLLHPTST